jgi:hypothetical protein
MWQNVLSLDAPVVAVTWLFIFAREWNVSYVEPLLPWVLGLVVWVVYAADRLLDCHMNGDEAGTLRHEFHRTHKKKFIIAICVATLTIAVLSLFVLQMAIIINALLPLAATAGFFMLSIFSPSQQRVSYSKNLLAGYAFAWGVGAGLTGLLNLAQPFALAKMFSADMLAFGLLCVINITAVDLWVKGSNELNAEEDEMALNLPLVLLGFFCLLFMKFISDNPLDPFFLCILIATALMYVINRMRAQFSTNFLRVSVDAILLITAAFYFVLSLFDKTGNPHP